MRPLYVQTVQTSRSISVLSKTAQERGNCRGEEDGVGQRRGTIREFSMSDELKHLSPCHQLYASEI
jgi:hypothetical protein